MSDQLDLEVQERFGVLPNFFRLAPGSPDITASLWGFARFAYLDNPLPSLFKERLFVYLSRFCEVRYCIARHVGFLTGLGRPAGDAGCVPQTVDEILPLLRRPLPRSGELELWLRHAAAAKAPLAELPEPDSPMEQAIFSFAGHAFVQTADAERSLDALHRLLGDVRHQHLLVFLAFVRTAHYWTRVHTELRLEQDIEQLLATHEKLAEAILNDPEAPACEVSRQLLDELAVLRERQSRHDELARAHEALQRAEERYRSLVSVITDVPWTTDAGGAFVAPQPAWSAYTGQSWEELRGFGWLDAIHPEDRERVKGLWLAAGASRLPYRADGRLWHAAAGQYRWYEARAIPILGADGAVREWVGTCTDVHDRRQAEEQLRQTAKMEAIGRLAGGIAHDFNNQLHAVSGFAEMVARDPGIGARAQADLGEVRRATERMAGLTRQLLAFSRQQVLQPEVLQLNAAVVDGSALLQRLLGADIEMSLELTAAPTWVRVDRAQLLQVLMNLAINARDAMPRGGRISIRTGRQDEPDGPCVALSVSDTGCGISPEHLKQIFEPFFTTKEVGKGTGLGLATVHGVVSQSRGRVWAESEVGRGTTFTVLLPAVSHEEPVPPPVRAVPEGASPPACILVVDDEDAVRAVIARTLEDAGHRVLQARDGREALESLAAGAAVDLVLSDVVMPELGGRDFGERLAAEHPDLPVVWISGHPRDSVFGDTLPSATQPFLLKPVPAALLGRAVAELLERPRAASR